MSLELIYTSAPRGLAASSSGFCTVAATAGMSRQMTMKLESLSGYQFHFGLSDPKAHLNPVNYAHTRLRIGSETFSVLSRIAFCGADHSGRTNKIAHHILLEAGERLDNGPAWMLMALARGVFVDSWQGEPKPLDKRQLAKLISGERRPSEPATTWATLTGDAGWGGALAHAFRQSKKVPAFVQFEPGMELLPLFEESLAILPPAERWEVGFCTYFSSSPPDCQYHWRGILAGSPAAKDMRRFPQATAIDLTQPMGRAGDDAYTEAARAGRTVEPEKPKRAPIRIVDTAREPAPLAASAAVNKPRTERKAEPAHAKQGAARHTETGRAPTGPTPAQFEALLRRARRARWVGPLLAAAVVLALLNIFQMVFPHLVPLAPPRGPFREEGTLARHEGLEEALPPDHAVPSADVQDGAPALKGSSESGGDSAGRQLDAAEEEGGSDAREQEAGDPEPERAGPEEGEQDESATPEMPESEPSPDSPEGQDAEEEPRPGGNAAASGERAEPSSKPSPTTPPVRVKSDRIARQEMLARLREDLPEQDIHGEWRGKNKKEWVFRLPPSAEEPYQFVGLPRGLLVAGWHSEVSMGANEEPHTHNLLVSRPRQGTGHWGLPERDPFVKCSFQRLHSGVVTCTVHEQEAGALQTPEGKWLAIEFTDANRIYRLVPPDRDELRRNIIWVFGYDQEGQPLSEYEHSFEYPWPAALTLRMGAEEPRPPRDASDHAGLWQWPVRLEPQGTGSGGSGLLQSIVTLDVSIEQDEPGLRLAGRLRMPAEIENMRQGALRRLKREKRKISEKSEDLESYKARLRELESAKKDKGNKSLHNWLKGMQRRTQDQLEQAREDYEEARDQFLENASTVLDELQAIVENRAQMQLCDPWGVPVAVVEIRFSKCDVQELIDLDGE